MSSTYEGKDLATWTAEINGYEVDDVISDLVTRLYENLLQAYDPEEQTYNNLQMENKPPLSVFEDELVDFKVDELARVTAIIAELDRIAALSTRLDALPNIYEAVQLESLGGTWTDMSALIKHIKDDDDEALLAQLETHTAAIQANINKEAGIQQALFAREGGKRIVAFMNALNAAKPLTTAQVKLVLQDPDLNLIKSMLESGSLLTAKEEITAYVPDETLITTADKTAILAELTALGV